MTSSITVSTIPFTMSSTSDDPNRVQWSYLRYAGVGVEFFATIALLTLLGTAIDAWLGTSPILTIVLAFLGFAAATWNLIRTVSRPIEPPHSTDGVR